MSLSNTNYDISYISEANSVFGVTSETHAVEATKEDEPSITLSDTTLLCKENDLLAIPLDTPTEQVPVHVSEITEGEPEGAKLHGPLAEQALSFERDQVIVHDKGPGLQNNGQNEVQLCRAEPPENVQFGPLDASATLKEAITKLLPQPILPIPEKKTRK